MTELEASVARSFHSTRTEAPRCPHEWAADMNGIASSKYHLWHANHFSTSLSKLFCHAIGPDYGAPEEIWSWHKLATVSTRWPCQTNEANKCSICLQQHEQTNRIPEWRIFLVSKTRGRLHANGKMQQRALPFRWWWKPIGKVGNVLQCR